MPPHPKRRKITTTAVEEVTFDHAAREDYLTGFHKRKLERAKYARDLAEKKARAEKIEERKKLREERKADIERHVQEVNALLRQQPGGKEDSDDEDDEDDADEWSGIDEPPPIDHEAEYIDEDRYTTVTVEEMDLSREGIHKAEQAAQEIPEDRDTLEGVPAGDESHEPDRKDGKRVWTKDRPKNGIQKPKKKKDKFRYESKAERKITRGKQRAKNSKQAKARREQ